MRFIPFLLYLCVFLHVFNEMACSFFYFYRFWFDFLRNSSVAQAASQIIRDSVEPILEQYRPAILASLKFSTLTLGTVAPQFTGYQFNYFR